LCISPLFVVGANSNIVFSDNFESGGFSNWSTMIGQAKIENTTVHSGSYAANFSFATSACYVTRNIDPTNTLNYTYYVYFTALPTNYTCQILATDTSGRQIYYRIQNMNGAYYWRFSVANVEITNSSTPSVLPGQWYKIQLLANAGNNCTVYFLVNDQMKATVTNQTLGPLNQIRLGNDWIDFGAYLPKGEAYFDDATATNSITNFISSFAEGNGTITPSGSISVPQNGNQAFTIKAGAHYHLSDVLVDDRSVGAVTSYTFTNVVSIHSIVAVFKIDTNDISSSAGGGGSISPSGTIAADWGSSQTFTITANSGYHISDVKVNGLSVGAVDTYTLANITSASTITANFDPNPTPNPTAAPTSAPTALPTAEPTPTLSPSIAATPTPSSTTPKAQNLNIDYMQFGIIAAVVVAVIGGAFLLAKRRGST
jgi:hypothetical protein